jgi:WD40 repeat protein/serine/threonine protein kinase
MTARDSFVNAGPTLASLLAEQPAPGVPQAVRILQQLAAHVAGLHESGQLRRSFSAAGIVLDDSGAAAFAVSAPGSGESTLDLVQLHDLIPELSRLDSAELPASIESARQQLQSAGIALDPRQIDLCQLGALLCRLLTGESAQGYLRSPRVKGKVPAELRAVLERALGCNAQERFADARAFLAALDAVAAKCEESEAVAPTAAPTDNAAAAQPPALRSGTTGDTNPSFVASAAAPADTSVGPAQPSRAGKPAAGARDSDVSLPFTRLGHYEIVARIGRGGMGDVYRAYERKLDRQVAIKVLPAELARSEDFVRRFKAEATAAAKLIHPNIIQIHSIDEDAGHHFFVMQFVEGESLADLLHRRGKLSVDDTLPIVEQALAGLGAAHEQGMVHRDIKPGNILLDTRHRRALLADFGLVKSLESSATGHTATGVVMGTVDYISPEQGRGQTVDARSDLYSMGILLYQMLAGRLPFEADNPTALIFQHVYEQAPPLAKVAPDVPVALASVIEKLLAKSPADRHQTADAVLADLRAFRTGQPLPSRRASPPSPQTTIIRLPAFEDPGPLLPAGLTGLTPPNWWERTRGRAVSLFRRHAPEALKQLQNTQQQVDGAVAEYERRQRDLAQLARDAESVLAELKKLAREQRAAAAAAVEQARSAKTPAEEASAREIQAACDREAAELDRQIAEQEEQLAPIRLRLAQAQAKAGELRNQRDILNARLKAAGVRVEFGRVRKRSKLQKAAAAAVVIALAIAAPFIWNGSVASRNESAQVENAKAEEYGESIQPADNTVSIIPVGAAGEQSLEGGSEILSLAVSAASPKEVLEVAAITKLGKIRRFTIRAGRGTSDSASVPGKLLTVLTYSPTGKVLATADDGGGIHIFDSKSLSPVSVLSGHPKVVTGLIFSHDGSRLLSAGSDGTVRLWDVSREKEINQFPTAVSPRLMDWLPEQEKYLACTGSHPGASLSVWSTGGADKPLISFADTEHVRAARFVDAGRRVVVLIGNEARDLDAATGEVLQKIGDQSQRAEYISCDGRFVVLAGTDGTTTVWNLEKKKAIGTLPNTGDRVWRYVLSPDNQALITGDFRGTIRIWKITAPLADRQIRQLQFGTPVHALAFSRDGFHAAAGGQGLFKVWRVETDLSPQFNPVTGTISSIGFSPDGNSILYGTGDRQSTGNFLQLHGIDSATRSGLAQQVERRFPSREAVVGTAAVAVDESRVISATTDGSIRVWHARSAEVLSTATIDVPIQAFAVHRDMALLGTYEREVRLWNITRQEDVGRLTGHTAPVLSVAVSEDGRFAAAGSADRTVRVWHLPSGEPLTEFSGHLAPVRSVAISHYGTIVVSGSDDGTVGIWNTKDETRVCWLAGHVGPVLSVALSPDGRRALSGGADGTIRLWNLERD